METIVLRPFLRSLAVNNPAVFDVAPETMAKYRAMSNLTGVHYASEHNAKLLVTALMYRPKDETELARLWGRHRDEVAMLFVSAISTATVQIHQEVRGCDLKQAIFEATAIRIKSDSTLSNYARVLSKRSKKCIKFQSDLIYSAEIATAFARLAVECRENRRQSGLRTANKRWGYVPSSELQIA